MEYRSSQGVNIETREDGSATVSGYAAVFYDARNAGTEFDLAPDVVERIMPTAFDAALGDDVIACVNHNQDRVLARTRAGSLKLSVDQRGLKYEFDAPNTTIGKDAVEEIRSGILNGSSFAFMPTDSRWKAEDKRDIREIHSVALVDVGPVVFPAYGATSTTVRSATACDCACDQKWQRERQEWRQGLAETRKRQERIEELETR